jgi:hypothetical protein
MARGELGDRILAVLGTVPESTREIQDKLAACNDGKKNSQGAIGYALDNLITAGKVKKHVEGRPAKFSRTDDAAVYVAAESPSSPADEQAMADAEAWADSNPSMDEEDEEIVYSGNRACGFCSDPHDMAYHRSMCPRTIKKAAGEGRTWGCVCARDGHPRATDYDKVIAEEAALLALGQTGEVNPPEESLSDAIDLTDETTPDDTTI